MKHQLNFTVEHIKGKPIIGYYCFGEAKTYKNNVREFIYQIIKDE